MDVRKLTCEPTRKRLSRPARPGLPDSKLELLPRQKGQQKLHSGTFQKDASLGRSPRGSLAQEPYQKGLHTLYLLPRPAGRVPRCQPPGQALGQSWLKPPPLASWMALGHFPNLGFSICVKGGQKIHCQLSLLCRVKRGPIPRRHVYTLTVVLVCQTRVQPQSTVLFPVMGHTTPIRTPFWPLKVL